MQFKTFTVAVGDPSGCEELNRFLAGRRVLTVQRELIQNGRESCWVFCVEYLESSSVGRTPYPRKERVDYKTVLTEEQFAVFAKLRECRKELATKEGLPAFAVCTDEQLAEIARQRPETLADLKKIDGLGDAKVEKYGERLLEQVVRETRESGCTAREKESGESV